MSRIRQEISSVQFQIDARKANASMDALQEKAKDLNKDIEKTQADIKALGDVAPDNKQLLEFQKTLRGLTRDLNDVTRAQNELIKGVKAADKLWKAAQEGNIESLGVKSIKAGQRGLQQRMQSLQPGDEADAKVLRAYKAVIEEADIVMLKFKTDAANTLKILDEGGSVSARTMRETRDNLKELVDITPKATAEYKEFKSQLEQMEARMSSLSENERRLAGEIVTVADAMKMANTSTREAAEQRMKDAALAKQQAETERATLETQREASRLKIETAETEAASIKAQITEQEKLVKSQEALYEASDRADDEVDEARKKRDAARESTKQYTDAITTAANKVADLKKQLEELNATTAKPKVDTGELERLERQYDELTGSIEKEKQALAENATAAKEAYDKETEAAIEMAQAQNYSQKSLEDSIALLEKQSKVETDPKKYKEMTTAIETMQQRVKEMTGEWMSYAEARKLAEGADITSFSKDGGNFLATQQQMQQAIQTLTRRREELIKTIQKSGKATKEEEAEMELLEKQLKDLKFENDNFNMSHDRMMKLLKEPKKADDLEELKTAIKRADGELKRMKNSLGENSKEYQEYAKQVKQAKIELGQMEQQSKATASAFEKAWSRLKTYVGLYVGAAVAMQKIVATMGDLMELSDKMGEVRKTTGFTADEVGRLSDNLKKLDVRTSLTSLMELSSLAGSVGLKTQQDVQGFTEAANQLLIALPEMGNESARTLIKIAQATGDLQKNGGDVRETLEKVGSTIIALRANSASAAGPITDFVSRVGAVGAQAGISIDQIAALGSTIDALGGRVEMSATALSRMIPAIRNNSYAIANSIGVTESYLKSLAPMEQMVLIFQKMRDSIKGIDTSTEEGQQQMADNVEAILGKSSTMREVMKDLEQQGARAGIVFGLLSQNVDELQKQLGIAGEAYKDNIALQEEFNKMNETTAAKWARLKNQLEEMFVSDSAQRTLGTIIDVLRWIVDFISGRVHPALEAVSILLRSIVVALIAVKLGAGEAFMAMIGWVAHLRTNVIKLTQSFKAFYAANKANVWMAIAAAIFFAATRLYEWTQRLNKAAGALAEAEASMSTATRQAGMMFHELTQLKKKQDELNGSTETLKKRESALAEELEALRKKLGDGAEQSEKFKKKQEELAKAHEEVTKAEDKAKKATSDRLALINEINSKYSTYLGYMLSEASTAETVASAHDLIIASLKEEMYWREKNKAFETVTQQHAENLKDYREASLAELNGMDAMRQQNIMSAWQGYLESVTYDAAQGGFVIPGAEKAFKSIDEAMQVMKERFNMTLSNEGGYYMVHADDRESRLNNLWGESGAGGWGSWTRWTDRGFKDWTREQLEVLQETALLQNMSGSAATSAHETSIQKAIENTNALIAQAQERGGDVTNRQLAEAVVGIEKNLSKYGEIAGRYTQFGADTSLKGIANVLLKDLPADTRKAVEDEIQRVAANGINPPPKKTNNDNNPYGNFDRVTSSYGEWDADSLVNRRKEMLERVRSLANGADVQAVLSEDAKFISEATRKNITTTKQAIEWYNAERLKIQDALHERFLTNTGDWMDPSKKKGREKTLKDEWKAYLDELDAYYTERKAAIQQAQTDEGLSEADAQRRIVENEQIWRQRRMELQKLYANKSAEVTAEEQQAIFDIIAGRMGDSADFVQKSIGKTVNFALKIREKSEKEYRDYMSKLDKGVEQDYLKQQNALAKQLNAIRDIIAKERPYDGIVDNLHKNLDTMGILFAELDKKRKEAIAAGKELEDDSARRGIDEQTKRLSVLLGAAENAYELTWEDLAGRLAKEGLKELADTIAGDDQMQQAIMAQLRSTYDDIQNAIKKEASLIKKQVDIWWADIAPGADQSRKDTFERALSRMGLLEDSVKRANSLIGAGQASERVADKLAIKQMQIRLAMQATYYNKMREVGLLRIKQLEDAGKKEDAEHLRKSLNLALTQEQVKLDEQRVAIANKLEESQNRLYTSLKEWGELISSSLQSVFEASNTGQADFYTEQAKKRLTGEATSGKYIVVENAGTKDAKASYRTLTDEEALKIEQENARREAWKKVMDDINMKLSETITDQLNAMMQNASVDANTDAVSANTQAIIAATEAMSGRKAGDSQYGPYASGYEFPTNTATKDNGYTPLVENSPLAPTESKEGGQPLFMDWNSMDAGSATDWAQQQMELNNKVTQNAIDNAEARAKAQAASDQNMATSTQSAFAKMSLAANLYGIAYQTMSNDNMTTAQKFEMFALQAAGQAAISMLTANLVQTEGQTAIELPGILGKAASQLGPIAGPIAFAAMMALMGGLMGLAVSKVAKSKSQIAQVTGASASAGRLSTGMLTYAEGNVNEFTDPATLTPGRQYNVDGRDGKTYRARYMGKGAKTHITNGPEFHLVGEAGREAIIDAKTTRLIRMNDTGIWQDIQTLYRGGSLSSIPRRRRGIRAFADGNLEELGDAYGTNETYGAYGMDMTAMTDALNRQTAVQEALLERLSEPIKAEFNVYGPKGLIDSYDTGKKTVNRYGQKY